MMDYNLCQVFYLCVRNADKITSAIIHNRFQVIFARSKITKTSKEPAIPSIFEFSDRQAVTEWKISSSSRQKIDLATGIRRCIPRIKFIF